MTRKDAVGIVAKFGLWSSLAAIGFATLSPIELRPQVADLQTEHLAAFAVVGFLAGIAHPRRVLPVLGFVVATAACLEVAQHLVPGRHARWVDFAIKAAGGTVGLGLARFVNLRWRSAVGPTI